MQNTWTPSQRAVRAAGQPISELMTQALGRPELISLAAGFVDQSTLPAVEIHAGIDALLEDSRQTKHALQYGPPAGDPTLREMILARQLASDGIAGRAIEIDRVIITAGSNQLLYLLADTLLDPGDIVLCAAPTYFVFLSIVKNIGAEAVGVASDENGIIPESLDETLRAFKEAGALPRVKAIYLMSYFDNPASRTISADRRPKIVQLAKHWSMKSPIRVIDDTAYRELRYAGDDMPSLALHDEDDNTVIVAGTFSKSFSPGIRVGWGVLPKKLVNPVLDQKGNMDFGAPNFSQHIMVEILKQGLHEQHVNKLRSTYSMKLSVMLDALQHHLGDVPGVQWSSPSGGLYVWLRLPEDLDTGPDGPVWPIALKEGVLYVPGEYSFPEQGIRREENWMRLSFGVLEPELLSKGVELLAKSIRRGLEGSL